MIISAVLFVILVIQVSLQNFGYPLYPPALYDRYDFITRRGIIDNKLLSAAENIISYKLVVDSVGCDRSRRCVEEESHKSVGLSVSAELGL